MRQNYHYEVSKAGYGNSLSILASKDPVHLYGTHTSAFVFWQIVKADILETLNRHDTNVKKKLIPGDV